MPAGSCCCCYNCRLPAESWIRLQAARVLQREWKICWSRWATTVQSVGDPVAITQFYTKRYLLGLRIAFLIQLDKTPYRTATLGSGCSVGLCILSDMELGCSWHAVLGRYRLWLIPSSQGRYRLGHTGWLPLVNGDQTRDLCLFAMSGRCLSSITPEGRRSVCAVARPLVPRRGVCARVNRG